MTALAQFSEVTQNWFTTAFGKTTPPQEQGWPVICEGKNTLILAPTGSGKTLAAFLWGIDHLFQTIEPDQKNSGIRLLYISPLKALNNDVHRNLEIPLQGINKTAQTLGSTLPKISKAVRSGDTPQRERAAMLKNPPHILITTPESLYLMLTAPKARELFRSVETVIVDEIHTLAGNKRGAHLSISLERLQQLQDNPIQRIGLSATIRPLDEIAKFLGGFERIESNGKKLLKPRPVEIVNTGYKKPWDLQVVSVVDDFKNIPGGSIWPTITAEVKKLIDTHQSTLIFANNRRLAERSADWLNEHISQSEKAKSQGENDRADSAGLLAGGVAAGIGFMSASSDHRSAKIRAHHGSIAKAARLEIEQALKNGELPALVGTSSLELGIDIGSIDLVVQLQSPKSVTQGLQRVGRSGHLVGQTSKGRIFATFREDLVESAVIAGEMLKGNVESIHTPQNPLDVLAQQIVAIVATEDISVDKLLALLQSAYPFHRLSQTVLYNVLDMLSGRYGGEIHRDLKARISWDRVNNKLSALPGSRLTAITNGGTITDKGAFTAYLPDGKTILGELDEEFIFETRIGDTFLFGSQVWRVLEISDDRIIVNEAPGAVPRMPFWRGEQQWRPIELGKRMGHFRSEFAGRLKNLFDQNPQIQLAHINSAEYHEILTPVREWLQSTFSVDENSANILIDYMTRQLDDGGIIASDKTVVVEMFDDTLGGLRMVVHSPFGGRVNSPWALALSDALSEKIGVEPEIQVNDDGILLRFPDRDTEIPVDVIEMTAEEVRQRVIDALPQSALFGAQFRQNAARALLMPGYKGSRRTPFWLQRLRAKDILAAVKKFKDFPIVLETYRECLQDIMDLPALENIIRDIRDENIAVVFKESIVPSPVAQSLIYDFTSIYLYQWDSPKSDQQKKPAGFNRELLEKVLPGHNPEAILQPVVKDGVRANQQFLSANKKARTAEELMLILDQLGDLSNVELEHRCAQNPAHWIKELRGAGRIDEFQFNEKTKRWISSEFREKYTKAFSRQNRDEQAREKVLHNFIFNYGPVRKTDISARYPFPENWLKEKLSKWISSGNILKINADTQIEYLTERTLRDIQQKSIAHLRNEIEPVTFESYQHFIFKWQNLTREKPLKGLEGLRQNLQKLRGFPLHVNALSKDILKMRSISPDTFLEELNQNGELVCIPAAAENNSKYLRLFFRGEAVNFVSDDATAIDQLSKPVSEIYALLKNEGALYFKDLSEFSELTPEKVNAALKELTGLGLVTNDSLSGLLQFIRSSESTPISNRSGKFASDLEQRLEKSLPAGRFMRGRRDSRYRAVKKRVHEKFQKKPADHWTGRWSLVHRMSILGKPSSDETKIERQTRQLLYRYGIVSRKVLERESGSWQWDGIYEFLKILELRGEVRRGIFVKEMDGLQFAHPDAIEELTHMGDQMESDLVLLNAVDPANLQHLHSTEKSDQQLNISRIPANYLVFHRGFPLLGIETSAGNLKYMANEDGELILSALKLFIGHYSKTEKQFQLFTANSKPILDHPLLPALENLGFFRDYNGLTWQS